MSTVISPKPLITLAIPLLGRTDANAVLARHRGRDVTHREYLRDVRGLAAALPDAPSLVNLCTCSYHFLVTFGAGLLRGQPNLLPASRADQIVAEVLHEWPGSTVVDDALVGRALAAAGPLGPWSVPDIPAHQVAVIGFTSGSTGRPKPHAKTWGSFAASTEHNRSAIVPMLGGCARFSIVATVPPQHMYGIELSVLMPLLGGATLHTGRDLFPADIAHSLAEMPAPRVLVTTPVHLRALAESEQVQPELAAVVSATAPLSQALATLAETELRTTVLEMFGSTETCVIAFRRTAQEVEWQLMPQVSLSPQADGTLVQAPWFQQPTLLQDLVECLANRRFRLCGRNSDQIEIAGKRASLADLTRRLQSIEGIVDAALVQPDGEARVRRLVALVVAPMLSSADILRAFRACTDPAFAPRQVIKLDALPRNAVGKLPRQALLDCLADHSRR